MEPQSPKGNVTWCEGLIIDNGNHLLRRIDQITFYEEGNPSKTLRGSRLPRKVVFNTGKSQDALTVLDLFYDEKVRRPLVVRTLPVEPNQGRLGRDAVAGVIAVIGFHVLLAIVDAIAKAMPS